MEQLRLATFRKGKVWWDAENQVIRSYTAGIVDEEVAQWFYKQTVEFGAMFDHKVDWILDMKDVTKPSSKARKILAKAVAHESIRKYAMVGSSVFLRTVTNFILTAAGQTNARNFATDEEALAWIRKEA